MISTALLKEQLKRNWVMMILTLIGYLMAIILPIFAQGGGGNNVIRAQRLIDLLAMTNPAMLIATIVVPFSVIMLLFTYLFNPKAQAMYYTLTDSKSQLFWTSVVSALILIIVPLIILTGVLFIRIRFPGDVSLINYPASLFSPGAVGGNRINTFPVIATFFMRTVTSFMFYFTLFLLAVTLSGNWVIATGIFGILPFIPLAVQRLFQAIANTYVFGFFSPNTVTWQRIMAYTNPLAWMETWGRSTNQSTFFLIYIGVTLIALLLAAAAFASRKLEQGTNTIVFPIFKNLLIFLLSVAGMIAMGAYFMSVLHGRWFVYYGFIIGFIIVYCVTQMAFGKTFNIIDKVKWIMPMIGIAAAIYGIMFLVTTFAMRPYTQHIPNASQIAGVYVSHETPSINDNDFTSSSTAIEDSITLHEQILATRTITGDDWDDLRSSERRDIRSDERDHRSDMRDAFWDSATGGGRRFREEGGQHLYIVYLLNNGDRIYRRYALPGWFLYQQQADLPLTD